MKILVLGGTGAMGVDFVKILAQRSDDVTVTSRSERKSEFGNVKYVRGDAHDTSFLKSLLSEQYDAIVDFMVYNTEEFTARRDYLLDATDQYVFLSSSRVYADSKKPITEDSPRLLDVTTDTEYLRTDEYALAKARQEDLLRESGKTNWTIIRPYITYSRQRLQLGTCEKESWLYRVLHDHSIIFPKDMAEHITTLTDGEDVARGIASLVGNQSAYCQTVHITTNETISWGDVIELYQNVFFFVTGKHMKVTYIDSTKQLRKEFFNEYQTKYDRMFDRCFDNRRIMCLSHNTLSFISPKEGLKKRFQEFLKNPSFLSLPSVKAIAWMDLIAKEKTPLSYFPDWEKRAKYIIGRYTPYFKIK